MSNFILRILTSISLLTILFLSYLNKFFFLVLIILISLQSIYELTNIIGKIKLFKKNRFYLKIITYLYFLIVSVFLFINFDDHKNIIFYFILICVATDIGGFIFGKLFKGIKLTPISPKKTYSGLYGSFILSFIVMYLVKDVLNLNIIHLLIYTFSVSLLSQIGDIFFSYLKRLAKIKDSGTLLPGHGGIIDRVDGIIISVPINILIYILSL